MGMEYIRKTYGLSVKVGQEVRIRKGADTWFDGMTGRVLRAQGPYVVVKGKTWRGNFHPADIETIDHAALKSTSPGGGSHG